MKHRDGYLISDDDVMQLELEVIEDIAYRVFKDSYLTEEAKLDILDVYLDCRWRKKEKTFVYNEENLKRVSDMNDLLIRQTKDAVKLSNEIFLQEMEVNKHSEKKYEIEVIPRLLIPTDMYWTHEKPYEDTYTERDERIWEVLTSSYNKKYQWYSILPSSSGFHSYQTKYLESCIEEDVVWGESLKGETPEQRSWGCVMNIDRKKCKDICFCWAFHNLLDFINFSMDDILKVKKFNMEIEVNYEPKKTKNMVKGMSLFICTECGHRFKALDIEYLCTVLSTPQKCPKCQSIRTRPVSIFGKLQNKKYESIWRQMENN